MPYGKMNGSEVINEMLSIAGVKTVFGYLAEDNMELLADIETNPDRGIEMVHTRHEQGAMAMADAYSRIGDRIGVCMVGRGPGIAQTGTALINAQKNGSNVLVVVPTPSQTDTHDPKDFKQEKYLESTAGSVINIQSGETIFPNVRSALRQVNRGNGPVAVQVPKNVLKSEVSAPDEQEVTAELEGLAVGNPDENVFPSFDPSRIEPDSDKLEEAVELYLDSDAFQPPVLLVGDGAVKANAKAQIEELAERLNAILLTTLNGRDLFADHPFAVGFSGNWGEPLSNEFLSEANYVLAIGCSLNNHTIDDGYLIDEDATVIHIDSNPDSIGEYFSVDLAIVGDAKRTVTELNQSFEDAGIDRGTDLWTEDLRDRIAEYSALDEPAFPEKPDVLDPRDLVEELEEILPSERLVGSDGGNFRRWVLHGFSASPNDSIMGCDFAAIGLGLPMGIGIGRYREDRNRDGIEDSRVPITFCGDGGLLMSVQELETAARHEIPIIVVVGNDSSLGSEYHFLDVNGLSPDVARLSTPSIARVAESFGAEGYTIETIADLENVAEELQDPNGPVVLECIIDHEIRHHFF